jgi:hypothetical protein
MEASMLGTIQSLRLAAEKFAAGQLPDPRLLHWLAASLQAYVDHRAPSLEEAMGIRRCKGGMPWWKEEAVRARNHALREICRMVAHDEPLAEQVRKVGHAINRYGVGRWRFDRHLEAIPQTYLGRVEEWLWHAYRSGAPLPLGVRQLRTILAVAEKRHRCS